MIMQAKLASHYLVLHMSKLSEICMTGSLCINLANHDMVVFIWPQTLSSPEQKRVTDMLRRYSNRPAHSSSGHERIPTSADISSSTGANSVRLGKLKPAHFLQSSSPLVCMPQNEESSSPHSSAGSLKCDGLLKRPQPQIALSSFKIATLATPLPSANRLAPHEVMHKDPMEELYAAVKDGRACTQVCSRYS